MMYSKVYVEITNRCNQNCSFCPGTKRLVKSLSMEEFQIIVNKLKGITKYLYLHVMGEPLIHPLLMDFIQYATEQGFLVAITTNGTLLKKRGQELINSGVYKVNISVHSFENGTKEEYEEYLSQCISFADIASKQNILTILRLWNRGFDAGRNIDIKKQLETYFDEPWQFGSRGARIRPKLHLEYGDRFTWPDLSQEEEGTEVFCYGLKDHFGILCDGRVIPCCLDREGVITLGNIFDDSVEEILSTERAIRMKTGFQRRQATEELCRKCGYARRF